MIIDRTKEDPLRNIVMKMFDPNIDSPDIFYKMDEVDKVQILRRYDKSSGEPVYTATYEILFKTEEGQRFCLIMQRIGDEDTVPDEYALSHEDEDAWVVCEYSPGFGGRTFLKGLPDGVLQRVVDKYEKTQR